MPHFIVNRSSLKGALTIPSSKSQTLRAILFGTLAKGKTTITNHLLSPDANAMISACRLLGGKINISANRIEIDGTAGNICCPDSIIDAGNSGIVLRFVSAIAALSPHHTIITGDVSIRTNRPMMPLLNALNQLSAHAISTRNNGYAPISIRGPIQSGSAILAGQDSQPVSALLISGAFASGPIELHVQNPGEKPWIGMTLSWLDRFKIPYQNKEFAHYILPGKAVIDGFSYAVPGDLSSAAFPIAAALLTKSELTLHNVDLSDCQGDKQVIAVMQQMGAQIDVDEKKRTLHVKKTQFPLKGVSIDINDFIDGIAILAVLGCFAEGTTHLKNAAIARTKECDRIHCLFTELRKMGANIEELPDGLEIKQSHLHGAHVHSHHDHRLAMALTVAGMALSEDTIVEDVGCISKSYPNFLEEFSAIGASIQE